MRLVYTETHQEVKIGDKVTIFRGEPAIVNGIEKPKHGGSTGWVYLYSGYWKSGFFPSVIGAEWVEREDQ